MIRNEIASSVRLLSAALNRCSLQSCVGSKLHNATTSCLSTSRLGLVRSTNLTFTNNNRNIHTMALNSLSVSLTNNANHMHKNQQNQTLSYSVSTKTLIHHPVVDGRIKFDDGDDIPFVFDTEEDIKKMTNDELADTSTIPGWHLVHTLPRKYPRGSLIGVVCSDKMNKTVNVAVDRYRIAPKLRMRVRYTRKFMAHDEREVARAGDLVMIIPCHRLSKNKHFLLSEIIRPKGQL